MYLSLQVCREAWSALVVDRGGTGFLVTPIVAVPLLVVSASVTLVAARVFASRLDRLGSRFGFPEALVGLLTALAADGPELSSALFALIKGQHAVGVGVLVGSNAFNLAAMIGLSALLAGSVHLSRDTLLLEGLVGGVITLIAAAVLLGWLAASIAALLAACVLIPYLVLIVGGSELLAHRGPNVDRLLGRLAHALGRRPSTERVARAEDAITARRLLALIVLDVTLIVLGSAGMVQSALALAGHWHISATVLGVLVLAPLTSLPNALTAVRLGLAGRGAALVGETFNSNTINLTAGVIVPSLFVGLTAVSATGRAELAWLVGMTCACLLMLASRRGLRRAQAVLVILMYLGFATLQLL